MATVTTLCFTFSCNYRAQFHFKYSSSYNMRMGKDLGVKLIVACSVTDVELRPGRGRLVKAFRTWGFRLSESCFSITLSSLF